MTEDKSSVMKFMIEFLKEYDYPFINTMNGEEISKIFNISNRCFLLSWAVKVLDEEYVDVLENKDNNIEFLSDLIFSLGFNASKQKESFFKGGLPVGEEIDILYGIFKFVDNCKKAPLEVNTIEINELHAFECRDVNLFPELSKFETFLRNNKASSSRAASPVYIHGAGTEPGLSEGTKDQLMEVFGLVKEKFGSEFHEFVKTVSKVKKIKRQANKTNNYEFEPRCEEVIKAVHDNLTTVQKHFEDLNVINSFEVKEFQQPSDDISPLMNAIADEFND